MTHPFVKMNGAGNDFIVINAMERPFAPTSEQARALADRETGPAGGCDQLIVIEPSQTGDAFMRVWNADGGVVETCGNALRCVGWLLTLAGGRDRVVIDTLGGPTTAARAGELRVTVDMGPPRLAWDQIPLAEEMDTRGIELQVGPVDAPVLHTPGAVSMGNPHVVFFVDHVPDDAFVRGAGSLIEHHPLFPEGVNVGFAHVEARDRIRLQGLGAGRGPDPGLRHRRLRRPGGLRPPGPDRPGGDGDRGRRRAGHRLARERRPRADDRPGSRSRRPAPCPERYDAVRRRAETPACSGCGKRGRVLGSRLPLPHPRAL